MTNGESDGELRKWLVLLAFSFNSACNAFMFMDYASVSSVAEDIFDCGDSSLNWLYSASLLTVIPAAIPASYFLNTRNWETTGVGVLCNCVGGWLRWWATKQESYWLALASSIAIGLSAAVIITSVTQVAMRWFPADQRGFACGIAAQANYFGWCLGGLIPNIVKEDEQLKTLLFFQALVVTTSLILFLAFHRARPSGPVDDFEGTHSLLEEKDSEDKLGMQESLRQMFTNPQFGLQCICFSLLGGISFTIPAVQDIIFDAHGFSSQQTTWTNFSFIATGVVTGLVISAKFSDPRYLSRVLKTAFLVASITFTLMTILTYSHKVISKEVEYVLYVVLMSFGGAASLGFISLGLASAAETAHPVSETYSSGAVEWLLQGFGALLIQMSTANVGFILCAIMCWIVTIPLLFFYKTPTQL
ncbi:hypothetical protein CYMTET_9421 [Cymbomonas tetramitiformis]|uniref:Uncharacterized protein n=1 Tax=Cymbomonas tetramitiformis TaxID=36881 RepID=A0AAE0LFH0_9CHLO|nr:hypothetical protein CYMTET_9421 [Cymbomonas tetramitiformis]